MVIDFDNIGEWAPLLTTKLESVVTEAALAELLAEASDKSVPLDCHLIRNSPCGQALVEATIEWVGSQTIAGYHATRLTEAEVNSIRSKGLLPLKIHDRRIRIRRALSGHRRWSEVADRLDDTLQEFARGEHRAREGQVHLTLSRSGLVGHFNQYLSHGADVDRHIAYELLKEEGKALLTKDGEPRLITVAVPGGEALAAANPHFTVEVCLAWDRDINLICELLSCWLFRLADPNFRPKSLRLDCGMTFRSIVPPHWITSIETIHSDADQE